MGQVGRRVTSCVTDTTVFFIPLILDIGNDYTGGIFQSIGFKEFHKYLTMSKECRESTLGQKAFRDGLELLKLHTRQYTKSQRKWINNRFLKKSQPGTWVSS